MRLFLSVLAIAFALAAPLRASDTEAANRLFVEAVLAWQAAEAIPGEGPEAAARRADLLATVAGNLERIVTDHAGADLAVRLVIGERIGPLSLAAARAALAQAEEALDAALEAMARAEARDTCLTAPDRACVRALALLAARQQEDPSSRAMTLAMVASMLREPDLFDEALKAAQEIEHFRDSTISTIALEQARAGFAAAARETAALIADDDQRDKLMRELAETKVEDPLSAASLVAELGALSPSDLGPALAEARSEADAFARTVELGFVWIRSGDRTVLPEALEASLAVEDASGRILLLAQIAALLPRP